MDAIPHYNNLDITKYDTIYGVYTLGFIKKHFPNIGIIDPSYFIGDKCENLDLWLENKIKSMLQKYEKVCIIPYEEDIFDFLGAYSKIVNKFVNEELYHITLLNTYNDDWLLLYEEYNIKCKIVEFPWVLLNDCLTFKRIKQQYNPTYTQYIKDVNYLCMIGRPESHKINLVSELYNQGLHKYGLLTYTQGSGLAYPPELLHIMETIKPPYNDKKDDIIAKETGCVIMNDIVISLNVVNLFYIIENFHNIPLIINPETSVGIFNMTEKSTWPILAEKLFLIYGGSNIMQWIQRYYDIDMSTVFNISFDSIEGYNSKDSYERLYHLINDNVEIIKDCKQIYEYLKPQLKIASDRLPENMYNYFVNKLHDINENRVLLPQDIVDIR